MNGGVWDTEMQSAAGNPTLQQFWINHYKNAITYSSWFDQFTPWFPSRAITYIDSVAIYVGSEPAGWTNWVLKDSNGNPLYINWACSGSSCTQWHGDMGNAQFRAWKIGLIGERLNSYSYAGAWMDDVNMDFRTSNGAGTPITPIDPRTGSTMTLSAWRGYYATFMEEIKNAYPNHKIAHNSLWNAEEENGVVVRDANVARQIAAADYFNIEHGTLDGGLNVGPTSIWSVYKLLEFIQYVHSLGTNVLLMETGISSEQDRQFALAAFLLINDGNDLNAPVDPPSLQPGTWKGTFYDTDLGDALGDYRVAGNWVAQRDFTCGTVLFLGPTLPTAQITLPGTFYTLSGSPVTSISLTAKSGAILKDPTCSINGPAASPPAASPPAASPPAASPPAASPPAASPGLPAQGLIYDDALVSGWRIQNARSAVSITYATNPGAGTKCIQANMNDASAYGNFEFLPDSFSTSGYDRIQFQARANTAGDLSLSVYTGGWVPDLPSITISVTTSWQTFTVPLSAISATSISVTSVLFIDGSGGYGNVFFIDSLGFVAPSTPPPAATEVPPPSCGTCTHGSCSGTQCVCEVGWTGTTCSTLDNNCGGVTCVNGDCAAGVCNCRSGWGGPACDVGAADPCLMVDCGSHGFCDIGICVCEVGWTGVLCNAQQASCEPQGIEAVLKAVLDVPIGEFNPASFRAGVVGALGIPTEALSRTKIILDESTDSYTTVEFTLTDFNCVEPVKEALRLKNMVAAKSIALRNNNVEYILAVSDSGCASGTVDCPCAGATICGSGLTCDANLICRAPIEESSASLMSFSALLVILALML